MSAAEGFLRAWSKHENAARTTCPECHFESSEGYPPSHAPGCAAGAATDGALVLAWHHSTRSVAAHCFEGDRPLCQDSDPGEIIDRNEPGRLLGRTCEDCRLVYKSRILHAIGRARAASQLAALAASESTEGQSEQSAHSNPETL